jgi:hypothetical protein
MPAVHTGVERASPNDVAPSVAPVKIWACIGGGLLMTEAVLTVRWITGPDFTRIPSGPDSPPRWMQTVLTVGQCVLPLLAIGSAYWFLVRPWRRERRLTTTGLMWIAFLLAAPYDMMGNYWQYWFTYNSSLVNVGSIVGSIPGHLSHHSATSNDTFPILLLGPAYVTVFMLAAVSGAGLMRAAKRHWPNLGSLRLITLCVTAMFTFDLVMEGFIFMPMGFWSFGGGHLAINASEYYRFPVQEALLAGFLFASWGCLLYFVNDRGETLVERGVSRREPSNCRKTLLRGLAMVAAIHLSWLLLYHVPAGLLAIQSPQWPKQIEKLSYFTNGTCGVEVDRACPGPRTPIGRPDAYINYEDQLVP